MHFLVLVKLFLNSIENFEGILLLKDTRKVRTIEHLDRHCFKLIAVFRSCCIGSNYTTASSTNVAEGVCIAKSQANIAETFLISVYSIQC